MSKKTADTHTLHIEYLYLDLTTCQRCRVTDKSLKKALAVLSGVFDTLGYKVRLHETEITSRKVARQHRFLSSPTIRVNGVDIETAVQESGCATSCRVFSWRGKTYEQPPTGLIVDALLRALYGDHTPEQKPYKMPANLDRFFKGVKNQNRHLQKGSTMASINVREPAIFRDTGCAGQTRTTHPLVALAGPEEAFFKCPLRHGGPKIVIVRLGS